MFIISFLISFLRALGQRGVVNIEQGWVQSFDDMIRVTYQQEKSMVASIADPRYVKHEKSAIVHFSRMSMGVANDNPGRLAPTVLQDIGRSERACFPLTSSAAVAVSNMDVVRSLNNPQNAMTQTLLAAMRRREDLHWINASVGSASTAAVASDGSRTYSTQAMLTAHKYDATGGSTAIILADIIKANKLLSAAGVPQGPANRIAFYSPGQLTDLLAITQASSSDFIRAYIHEKGTLDGVTNFEGFTWREVPDATDEAGTLLNYMLPYASSKRSVIFSSRMAVGLNTNQDLISDIGVRRDLELNPIQVSLNMTMGAVRVWDRHVVQVEARDV